MKKLQVASIQNNPVFGEIRHNLHDLLGLLPPQCDLAVLPELCATGYQFRDRDEVMDLAESLLPDSEPGPITTRLLEAARATGTTIVAGVAERDGDKAYNSALLVRPDGSREVYRKLHLFLDEKRLFDPGDRPLEVVEACGVKLGMMVCFDWIFPEVARTLALRGAQILAHPSNLVLPFAPDAMKTRCLENRVFALTANRVGRECRTDTPLEFIGLSQVMSPRGQRLASLDRTETGAAVATIELAQTDKKITAANDVFADRRPEFYW
ncbi:acyltransferase [bacterium DOLJORAL78_65_58]|nr:MAG: acyltransferase [bacterium DOLZORAL124_64_63]PIE76565.1 MAG: acyltransferase [bacterium DOLJORAL78_65_58]